MAGQSSADLRPRGREIPKLLSPFAHHEQSQLRKIRTSPSSLKSPLIVEISPIPCMVQYSRNSPIENLYSDPVPQFYTSVSHRLNTNLTPSNIHLINEMYCNDQLKPVTPNYQNSSRQQVFFPPDFSLSPFQAKRGNSPVSTIYKRSTSYVRNSSGETVKMTTTEYSVQGVRNNDISPNRCPMKNSSRSSATISPR